jgi:hypothetical protein
VGRDSTEGSARSRVSRLDGGFERARGALVQEGAERDTRKSKMAGCDKK